MPNFEIGMVYRKNSRYHLAVASNKLVTVVRGEFVEVRPYVKYEAVRHISVEELCQRWGITVERMDQETRKHLVPVKTSEPQTSSRRSREKGMSEAEALAWRELRTIKMAG